MILWELHNRLPCMYPRYNPVKCEWKFVDRTTVTYVLHHGVVQ